MPTLAITMDIAGGLTGIMVDSTRSFTGLTGNPTSTLSTPARTLTVTGDPMLQCSDTKRRFLAKER